MNVAKLNSYAEPTVTKLKKLRKVKTCKAQKLSNCHVGNDFSALSTPQDAEDSDSLDDNSSTTSSFASLTDSNRPSLLDNGANTAVLVQVHGDCTAVTVPSSDDAIYDQSIPTSNSYNGKQFDPPSNGELPSLHLRCHVTQYNERNNFSVFHPMINGEKMNLKS